VERPERRGADFRVTVTYAHLDRLVYLLDGHTQDAVHVQSKQSRRKQTIRVPRVGFEGTPAHELRVEGYALRISKGKRRPTLTLAASARVKLPRK
jgi:hypothetical protein